MKKLDQKSYLTLFKMFVVIFLLSACFTLFSAARQGNIEVIAISGFDSQEINTLIPLYIYPDLGEPNSAWNQLVQDNSRIQIIAIINPNSGPSGCPPNDDYETGIETFQQSHVSTLGYVFTRYGERDFAQVKADVDTYFECYQVSGIFFDEAANSEEKLAYYAELGDYVRSKGAGSKIVLNPGTSTDERYIANNVCDTCIIFEDTLDTWNTFQPSDYVANYPSNKFAALVHSAPDTTDPCLIVELAKARNIGSIYITDDNMDKQNPWDSLPSFWNQEVDCISKTNGFKLWLPFIIKRNDFQIFP